MASTLLGLRNVLFLCSFFALAYCKQLPSYIKPCKRHDPNLEQCLIKIVHGLKPRLAKGIPEMRIPQIEPFYVPLVRLNQGSEAVNFKASFKNLNASNGLSFDLKKLKIDFSKPSIDIDVFFPKLNLVSFYKIDGKVLIVPIKGEGLVKGNISRVDVKLILTAKYVPKNGKTFLQIEGKKIIFKIGDLQLHFDNLFGGGKNKALGETTNQFINQNWREIIEELNPLLEDTLGEILISIIKGFLEQYYLEDLLPEK